MEWLIVREGVEQVIPVKPRFERPPGRWGAGIGISEIEGRVVLQRVEPDSPAEVAWIAAGGHCPYGSGAKKSCNSTTLGRQSKPAKIPRRNG